MISSTHSLVELDNIKLIQVSFSLDYKSFVVSAVYRLNPTCPHRFNLNLKRYLRTINRNVNYSILVGDLNINIIDQRDYTHDYLNLLYEEGYVSQINRYTRVQGEKRSCIDHILVRHTLATPKLTPVVIENLITDHYPIVLFINFIENAQHVEVKHFYSKPVINYNYYY